METALIRACADRGNKNEQVSILVLLETALIPDLWRDKYEHAGDSFNPCFIGNCSHTWVIPSRSSDVNWFQSLFYWKLLSYKSQEFHTAIFLLFQSLFYWKLLSYSIAFSFSSTLFPSFNPCFIGNCSHTFPMGSLKNLRLPRFNPCFIGNCSHT